MHEVGQSQPLEANCHVAVVIPTEAEVIYVLHDFEFNLLLSRIF